MAEPFTAADVARLIADTLERHDVPYAIGGAIALGYYAPPRATVDVDVNVFVEVGTGLEGVLTILREAGFEPDADIAAARARAVEDGQVRGRAQGLRVDVFFPAVPFYDHLAEGRRQVVLLGRPLWIVGPEDLAVLKLMFFRRKDLADVEAMLRDQGDRIDRAAIRRALVELVGEQDERIAALDEIARDVDAG